MSAFTGTMALVRLALRRDRLRLTLWITGLAAITAITVDSLQSLYPTREALAAYANTISGNVAVIAMSGPDRALDTLGGRAAFEIWQYCAAIALMAVFAVTRGARAEEESGRSELVRAAAVGRHAHSAAAIAVATLACVAVGVLIAGALWALGLPLGGSATLGAGFASIGVGFAAVSLVANQLTAHARAANGIAGAAVAVGYVLRAVGDTSMPALSWLSPFGWAQAMHPFSGNRWWPLALCLAVSAALVVLALALEERRDLGAGILPDRAGPATAGVLLGSPIGLAWRLQRASILAWVVGSVMLALIMGTMVDDADDLVGDNEALRQYLAQLGGASLAEIFLATLLGYFALAAVGFALQSVVRLRTEELKGRAELVLALGVSRRRWLATQLAVTVVGVVLILVLSGAALGVSYGMTVSDPGQIWRTALAGLAYVPAVFVVAGIGVLAFGLRSRAVVLGWVALAFVIVEFLLGQVLNMPSWVRDLSPLHRLSGVPTVAPSTGLMVALVAIAGVMLVAGLAGWGRRDVG